MYWHSSNLGSSMRIQSEPIQLQFIIPKRASVSSRRRILNLRKLAEKRGTIHLQLSLTHKNGETFEARLMFNEELPDGEQGSLVVSEPPKYELATEQEIRSHALAISNNVLFNALEPAKRLFVLMNRLDKAVRLKTLVCSCQDILTLNYDTIRGTLNKNGYGHCKTPLYYSPERGIWCTLGLAEKIGIMS